MEETENRFRKEVNKMSGPSANEIFNNLWDEADGAEQDAQTLEDISESISNDSDDSDSSDDSDD